jgi:hypothetical protein
MDDHNELQNKFFKLLILIFMNLINSLAIFDIILFTTFFVGINLIFYKLITEILTDNKIIKLLAIVSILGLNILYVSIVLFTFLKF